MQHPTVTAERLERAIITTARVIQEYRLPQLLPVLTRLEKALDDLLADGDAFDRAAHALARISRRSSTNPALADASSSTDRRGDMRAQPYCQ